MRKRELIALLTQVANDTPFSQADGYSDQPIKKITEVLENDPHLTLLRDGTFTAGVGSTAHTLPDMIAHNLWKSTAQKTPARIVNELEELITKNNSSFVKLIMVLSGVEVLAPVILHHGISLVPLCNIANSDNKKFFLERNPYLTDNMRLHSPDTSHLACLVKRYRIKPFLVPNGSIDPYVSLRHRNELRELAHALATHRSLAPSEIASWMELENPRIKLIKFSHGFSPGPEMPNPVTAEVIGKRDHARIRERIRLFRRIGEKKKSRLLVPLERLVRSRRSYDYVQRALDLGIAFESLLTTSNEGHSELVHKISTRGARFIASTENQRTKVRSLLKATYDLRSKAIHTGNLPAQHTVPGRGRLQTHQIIREGAELCGALLEKCLVQGGIPDWQKFDIQ